MIDIPTCFTYTYSAGTFADYHEGVTSAAVSVNSINLDAAGINPVGGSKPPWLVVMAFGTWASIASLGIKLITDSVEPVLDAATADDVEIWRLAIGVLNATNPLVINQPLPNFLYKQWITIEYEPYTDNTGDGSILAFLASGPETAITAIAQTVTAGT